MINGACFYSRSFLIRDTGLVLGGTQALSRSLYSQLIPKGREAEYFSLYQAMERGTSWLGTLIFGLGTRLGSLVAIGMAANITIGILNVPHEWGWTYVMLLALPALFLLADAGRSFGVDSWIAPRLEGSHHPIARLARWLV